MATLKPLVVFALVLSNSIQISLAEWAPKATRASPEFGGVRRGPETQFVNRKLLQEGAIVLGGAGLGVATLGVGLAFYPIIKDLDKESKDNRSRFVTDWMNKLSDFYSGYGVCVIKSDQVQVTKGKDNVKLVTKTEGSKQQSDFIMWHDRLTGKKIFFHALLVPHGARATIKNTGDGGYLNWACKDQPGRLTFNGPNEADFS